MEAGSLPRMPPPLLILGASARAAAMSARRAGFAPTAVDLFADRDLAAIGPAHRVGHDAYPEALADVAARLPEAPWIYTGGLENHPDLVDRIARDRPLLGITGAALRDVRDPIRWTEALRRAGVPALDCVGAGGGRPGSGDWLLKPVASAAGRGIRPWMPGLGPIPEGWYVQRIARGSPLGACFVGDGASARLAGVTRQILGASSPRGTDQGSVIRTLYEGSVGPCRLGEGATRAIARIGDALASAFGLRGLFGVDLILEGATPWAVEINPRYTASVEVLEEGLGVTLLDEHARAFGVAGVLSAPARGADTPGRVVAKRILWADRPAVVPEAWPRSVADASPTVADIPAPGTILRPGDPVLTVFARGRSPRAAWLRLRARAARWRRRIDGWPSP